MSSHTGNDPASQNPIANDFHTQIKKAPLLMPDYILAGNLSLRKIELTATDLATYENILLYSKHKKSLIESLGMVFTRAHNVLTNTQKSCEEIKTRAQSWNDSGYGPYFLIHKNGQQNRNNRDITNEIILGLVDIKPNTDVNTHEDIELTILFLGKFSDQVRKTTIHHIVPVMVSKINDSLRPENLKIQSNAKGGLDMLVSRAIISKDGSAMLDTNAISAVITRAQPCLEPLI